MRIQFDGEDSSSSTKVVKDLKQKIQIRIMILITAMVVIWGQVQRVL